MALITVSGNLKTLSGGAIVNGTVTFALTNYGTDLPRVSGTTILDQATVIATSDGTGAFSVTLYGNDAITPSTTYYVVSYKDSTGTTVITESYLFTGAVPIDLTAFAPLLVTPGPPVFVQTGVSGNFLVPGTLTVQTATLTKALNNVRYADQFPGATADAQIRAAIADITTSGVVSCLGYGSTVQQIAAKVDLGSATKRITLLVDEHTTFNITITNGDDAFVVWPNCAIIGTGQGGTAWPTGFALAATANVNSVITNAKHDGTQEFFWIENLYIQGHPSATCPALLDLQAVYINSGMRNCVIDNPPAIGLHLQGAAGVAVGGLGPFVVDNCWINGENVAGARPVVIEAQGSNGVGAITFIGCAIEHQGTGVGAKLVEIDGHGFLITGVQFLNTYFENHNYPSANASSIGVSIRDCDGVSMVGCVNGGLTGADFINVSDSSGGNINNNVVVIGSRNYAFTNHVNDTVNSNILTQHFLPHWIYAGNGNDSPQIGIGEMGFARRPGQPHELMLTANGSYARLAVQNSITTNDQAYLGWAGDNKCRLSVGNNRVLTFNVNSSDNWQIGDGANPHLIINGDNLYDIGLSASARPRSIYAATSVTAPALIGSTSVTAPTVTATTALKLGTNNTPVQLDSFGLAGLEVQTGNSFNFYLDGNSGCIALNRNSSTGVIGDTAVAGMQITASSNTQYRFDIYRGSDAVYLGSPITISGHQFLLDTTTPVSWNADTGLSRDAAGVVDVGNGTAGDASGTLKALTLQAGAFVSPNTPSTGGAIRLGAGDQLQFRNNANTGNVAGLAHNTDDTITVGDSRGMRAPAFLQIGGADTGLSRDSAGVIDVGNGTAGDTSGTIKAAKFLPSGSTAALNLVDRQGPVGAITGNSTDLTVFSTTLSAGQIGPGKCIRVSYANTHTGANSVTYNMFLGTTSVVGSWSWVGAVAGVGHTNICNAAGVQNSQYADNQFEISGATAGVAVGTSAENTVNSLVLKLTFNVAATDSVTPKFWMVEMIQ